MNFANDLVDAIINHDIETFSYFLKYHDTSKIILNSCEHFDFFVKHYQKFNIRTKNLILNKIMFENNPNIFVNDIDYQYKMTKYMGGTFGNSLEKLKVDFLKSIGVTDKDSLIIKLQKNGDLVDYVGGQTDEICKIAINAKSSSIKYIKNQTTDLCTIALNDNIKNFKVIKNNDFDLCCRTICQEGDLIRYVDPLTPEILDYAINDWGGHINLKWYDDKVSLLKYINPSQQTEEVCTKLVKMCPKEIRYAYKKTHELCLLAVTGDPYTIQNVEQTYELCIEALTKKPSVYKHIAPQKRTEEMDLLAIMGNFYNYQHVKNITPEIRKYMMWGCPDLGIEYIKNPTEQEYFTYLIDGQGSHHMGPSLDNIKNPTKEMCKYGLSRHPTDITICKNKKNLTKEMCIIVAISYKEYYGENMACWVPEEYREDVIRECSPLGGECERLKDIIPYHIRFNLDWTEYKSHLDTLKENPMELKNIPVQTLSMCWLAIIRDKYAIEFVKNPTLEMEYFVVGITPQTLKLIKHQTSEICWRALKKDPSVIEHIKIQTEAQCEYALKQDPSLIRYVKNQTKELCFLAIQKDPTSLKYIKNITLDMCLRIVEKNRDDVIHIENKEMRMRTLKTLFLHDMIKFVDNDLLKGTLEEMIDEEIDNVQ